MPRKKAFLFFLFYVSQFQSSKEQAKTGAVRLRMVFIFLFFLFLEQCLTIISGKIKGMVLQQVADNILYNHKLKYFSEYFRVNSKDVDKVTHLCSNFQGFLCFCCCETVKVIVRTWSFNSSTSHRLECWMGIDRSEETWSTCEKWALLQKL